MTENYVQLSQSEFEFHEAGVSQGRVTAMREVAGQLRQSREHYLGQYKEAAKEDPKIEEAMDNIEQFLQVFEALAVQFEGEGKRNEPLIEKHMTRGLHLRPREKPTLHQRVIGAMIGLVDGYKTGTRSWPEKESFPGKR